MTKVQLFFVSIFLGLAIFVISCQTFEDFPPEPSISYNDFQLFIDTISGAQHGVLFINYIDGDGDIGLDQSDTMPPYHFGGDFHYNLLVQLFELKQNELVKNDADFNARIPPLIDKEQTKSIQGVIEYEMLLWDAVSEHLSDTIQFRVQLIDRALNMSNEISTPYIVRWRETH